MADSRDPAERQRAGDQMVVALARLLRDGEIILYGVNSALPMAAVRLAQRLHAPHLTALTVSGAVNPAPERLPTSTVGGDLMAGSASIFANPDFYDLVARGGIDTAFLGAGQVGPEGRVNTSLVGTWEQPKVRLPGGGGTAVILPTAKRVISWRADHSPRIFVKKCDFVTAQGNLDRVVTPLCVFCLVEGRLRVESIHPYSSPEEVRAQTGFAVEVGPDTPRTDPPTDRELAVLNEIDPDNSRLAEFH